MLFSQSDSQSETNNGLNTSQIVRARAIYTALTTQPTFLPAYDDVCKAVSGTQTPTPTSGLQRREYALAMIHGNFWIAGQSNPTTHQIAIIAGQERSYEMFLEEGQVQLERALAEVMKRSASSLTLSRDDVTLPNSKHYLSEYHRIPSEDTFLTWLYYNKNRDNLREHVSAKLGEDPDYFDSLSPTSQQYIAFYIIDQFTSSRQSLKPTLPKTESIKSAVDSVFQKTNFAKIKKLEGLQKF